MEIVVSFFCFYLGQLILQVSKNERVLAMYQYDIRGNVAKLTQDNIETSYTYDNANRVTRHSDCQNHHK